MIDFFSYLGAFIGLAGGYLNRRLDYASALKQRSWVESQLATVIKENYSEGTKIAKDMLPMLAIKEDTYLGMLAKWVRPVITVSFFLMFCLVGYDIRIFLQSYPLSAAEVSKAYFMCIEWILFQTGLMLGWWFANRPSSNMKG